MMLLLANTATVKNVTPLTQLTSNHNKKKIVKKTSSRAVSLNTRRLLPKKPLPSATPQSSWKEMVQKYVKPSTSLLVLPVIKNMMSMKTAFHAKPSKKKSVKMLPKVTPLNKNVPNGLYKRVPLTQEKLRNTAQKPNVRRFPVKFVVLEPPKFPEKKSASTEKKPSSKKFQKKPVTWNPKESVNTSPNWYLSLNQLKNVLISQKKFALVQEPTQERSKNLLSRNGAMYQLLNLVLLKQIRVSKYLINSI